MRLKTLLQLAYKNLWSRKLRSVLTIAGMTIGIAAIIFLVSLGYGLEQLVTNQIANFDAFTIIDATTANPRLIQINQAAFDKIGQNGHIAKIGYVANLAGRVRKIDNESTAETVAMAAGADYWQLAEIKTNTGKLPANSQEIALNTSIIKLIGEEPASIIGKTITLNLIIPADLRINPNDGILTTQDIDLKVSGVIDNDQSPVAFIDASALSAYGTDKFSALKIKVDEKDKQVVAETRSFLENMGYSTEYIGDTINEINQVFSLFRAILAAFGLIALVVASVGTFNTLTVSLLERTREIGLMKALGMRNRDIYKLFLLEALFIGGLGGIFGLCLGFAGGQIINIVLKILANRSGTEIISLFVTPVSLSLIIAGLSIVVGFATGWYPAKRAVKINPLDALRYE